MKFWKDLFNSIAPPENRLVAAVAFVRTFGQIIRGSTAVAALLGAGVTVTDLATIDWTVLGFGVASIMATALIGALDAYFNVLANGLSRKYTEAMVSSIDRQVAASDDLTDAVKAAAKKVT